GCTTVTVDPSERKQGRPLSTSVNVAPSRGMIGPRTTGERLSVSEELGQGGLERLVCWRHVVEAELVGLDPAKLLVLLRYDAAKPALAEIKRHQEVELWISVAGEGKRHEGCPRDLDAKLLQDFADQRRLGLLAGLDLAAGKFPEPGKRASRRAPSDQHFSIPVEQRDGGNEHDRVRSSLIHVRTRRVAGLLKTGSRR